MSEVDCINNIFSLLKSTLLTEQKYDFANIEWQQITDIADRNLLIPLLYDKVKELSGIYNIPEHMLRGWKSITLGCMLSESVKYKQLERLLQLAESMNVTFILFKGCVLADLYPNYLTRSSCDTDILVYERDREKAIKILEDLGYQKCEKTSKEFVYVYKNTPANHIVELHFSLWEDFTGRNIDLIKGMQLDREDTLIRIRACGLDVTTLGYDEHLIFQMFHIIKHFSLQGVSIRYLADITLFLNRYENDINRIEFWSRMETLGYDKFCENFFAICVQYLGMSARILEGRKIKLMKDLNVFLMDLINIGFLFGDGKACFQLMGTMTPYFIGEQEIPKSMFRRRLKILFPAGKDLSMEYRYARSWKLLMPIAWVHRWSHFLLKSRKHKKDWYSAKEVLIVADHRLSLMRKLGLMDGGK
jgi:hypothetical protein